MERLNFIKYFIILFKTTDSLINVDFENDKLKELLLMKMFH